jgi:cytoskeletal protein CcmA (bactofilin family)
MRNRWYILGVAAFLVFVNVAQSQEAGEQVRKTGSFRQDLYLAGGQVIVDARVIGDVTVAGGEIRIAGPVTGDVLAAGGDVDLEGDVADDIRVVGGDISIAGKVAGDLVAAGGDITVHEGVSVGERAFLAGGEVTVLGNIGGHLRAAGGEVELNGTVSGPASIYAETLRIGPNARIIGFLQYTGPNEPQIADGARIEGGIQVQKTERPGVGGLVLAALGFILGLVLIAIVYALLFPRFSQVAADEIRREPWPSLGWGFLVLIVVPVLAVVLMVTVVGIPLGLLLLWVYPIVLLAGYLTGVVFIARWLAGKAGKALDKRGALVLWVLAAMVLWSIVQAVPVLGNLAGFFLWVLGIGAFTRTLFHGRHVRKSDTVHGGGEDI